MSNVVNFENWLWAREANVVYKDAPTLVELTGNSLPKKEYNYEDDHMAGLVENLDYEIELVADDVELSLFRLEALIREQYRIKELQKSPRG